ncbi:hypothetical protein TI39_contig614g00010 [Zymoseptoria brevis]|uniref:DUF7770 domain-containing protein n=1 Tax=Zymoseptoria brevis TaxID=1047168 RepID=A0A0F4GGP5_9PEZI|nr:hypothetical protein TI39_contig614g00010 [Zymoseptoria brevis]
MDLTLSCSHKNYRFTKQAAKVVHLTPGTPITVGRFMEILKQNKYDKYRFTTNGTGCRYWTHRVVELLRGLGVVDDTGAKEAATALNTVWRTEQPVEAGNQTSLKDHQGTFVG